MSNCWQQGFVNVRRLKNSDNVSAYLMAYLTDVDIKNPDGDLAKKKNTSKSIIKGGRLGLYPMHFQLYRRSRKGIKNPQKLKGTCGQIKDHFKVKKLLLTIIKLLVFEGPVVKILKLKLSITICVVRN